MFEFFFNHVSTSLKQQKCEGIQQINCICLGSTTVKFRSTGGIRTLELVTNPVS